MLLGVELFNLDRETFNEWVLDSTHPLDTNTIHRDSVTGKYFLLPKPCNDLALSRFRDHLRAMENEKTFEIENIKRINQSLDPK